MNTNLGDNVVVNQNIKQVCKPGQSKEDVRDCYNDLADKYETVRHYTKLERKNYIEMDGLLITGLAEIRFRRLQAISAAAD